MTAKKYIPNPNSVPGRLYKAMHEVITPLSYKDIADIANHNTTLKHITDSHASQGMLALTRKGLVKRKVTTKGNKKIYLYSLLTYKTKKQDPPETLTKLYDIDFLKVSERFFRTQSIENLQAVGLSVEDVAVIYNYLTARNIQ